MTTMSAPKATPNSTNLMDAELSLGPFCNWFLPSCLDVWSFDSPLSAPTATPSTTARTPSTTLMAYGARSSVCLAQINDNDGRDGRLNSPKVCLRDCVHIFSDYKSIVSSLKFNKYRKRCFLFVGSNTGEAAVIRCDTREIIWQTVDVNQLELPSKKILSADWSDGSTVYYCLHSLIVCWNIETGNVRQLMIGENYRNKVAISVLCASFSGKQKLAIGYMNGDITILSMENDLSLNIERHIERQLTGHNDDICALSFGWTNGEYPDGILASVSRDGFIKVWDVYRKHNIIDYKLDSNNQRQKNWFSLAFLPNNANNNKFELLIGSGNGQLLVIEVSAKPPSSKIRIHRPSAFDASNKLAHTSVIFSIAVDVNKLLAVSTCLDHQIIVWDLSERKAIESFYTFSFGAHDISFSAIEPSLLAIAIGDGLQLIKLSSIDNSLIVEYQRRIAFFSKGKDGKGFAVEWHPERERRLAIASSSGELSVIDINSSQSTQVITKYSTRNSSCDSSKIFCLRWGPSLNGEDEWAVYSVHKSGQLYLHYPSTKKVVNFNDLISEKKKRTDIAWKSDYSELAIGNEDGTVHIIFYNFIDKRFKLIAEIEAFDKPVLCVRWNCKCDEKRSNWLAVSSYDSSVYCYSLQSYNSKCTELVKINHPNWTLRNHTERISAMDWSPFEYFKLASASYDKTVIVWNVLTETPLFKFYGHRGILFCVSWSPFDADLIISGGEDNLVHAWRPSKHPFQSDNAIENDSFDWPDVVNDCREEEIICNVLSNCIDVVVSNEIYDEPRISKEPTKSKSKSSKKKTNNKQKKISLFPLSNTIEYSSTKFQKLEDIECLFQKINGENVLTEKSQRLLLYGDSDDVKRLIKAEMAHHERHANLEQRLILSLFYDIKSAIEESIQLLTVNPYLISLSMSVSRHHWKESCKVYVKQLIKNNSDQPFNNICYHIEMAVIYLLSQNDIKGAIDLLIQNNMHREALIVAKSRCESDQLIEEIIIGWADYRERNGDYEGAAKCLTSISKFKEAAIILSKVDDQQYQHTAYILRSLL